MNRSAIAGRNRKVLMPWLLCVSALGLARMAPAHHFVHRATAGNIRSNWTVLNSSYADRNPNALVFVTPNWNPGGSGGVYNNHAIGVWYTGTHWAIFNQDMASMPNGASFNVAVVPQSAASTFVHRSHDGNISSNWTVIDHPYTNYNPTARLLVTANWNPNGTGGVYNNHSIGVWYTGSRWAIFNQDRARMSNGAAFNVAVLGDTSFVHRATAANTIANWTDLNSVSTNGNPNAIVFATANWNPGGTGGTYSDHPTGVWYDRARSQWAVFNQDMARMPDRAAFNVVRIYP